MCPNSTEGLSKPAPPFSQGNGSTQAPLQSWSTGLCACYEDPCNCIVTICCPCVIFGENAEIIDKGNTSCCSACMVYYCLATLGCECLYTCSFRTKLRAEFSLKEDPCGDCLVHCCCLPCAICQEHRELKNRGLDPAKGWTAHAQKGKQGGLTVPPTVAPGMAR